MVEQSRGSALLNLYKLVDGLFFVRITISINFFMYFKPALQYSTLKIKYREDYREVCNSGRNHDVKTSLVRLIKKDLNDDCFQEFVTKMIHLFPIS